MSADDYIPYEVREQLLETLQEMGTMLYALEQVAEQRGCFDAWWTLVQQLGVVREQVLSEPVDPDFADSMSELCLEYDAFVETVLPNPPEH